MLLLVLIALGLILTSFAYVMRQVDEGYQDRRGFHTGSNERQDA
jgi:hypothetical protein